MTALSSPSPLSSQPPCTLTTPCSISLFLTNLSPISTTLSGTSSSSSSSSFLPLPLLRPRSRPSPAGWETEGNRSRPSAKAERYISCSSSSSSSSSNGVSLGMNNGVCDIRRRLPIPPEPERPGVELSSRKGVLVPPLRELATEGAREAFRIFAILSPLTPPPSPPPVEPSGATERDRLVEEYRPLSRSPRSRVWDERAREWEDMTDAEREDKRDEGGAYWEGGRGG